MTKKTRITLVVATSVLAVLCAASFIAGNIMLNIALLPPDRGQDMDLMGRRWEKKVPGLYTWYKNLHENGVFKDTCIVNDRGLRLHAVYAPASAPSSAEGTAVLVHGYTDNHLAMMNIARMYRDSLNFNVLMFDQQAHGLSEGDAIQMGWFDRLNAALWVGVADSLWHEDFMVVHGVSMGGATTMMLSGDPDPDCVKAYVEDCGYTSVWDQFAKELKTKYSLPPFPVLNMANLICRHRYGWDFREASSLAQLAKSTKPMLFIHGDVDYYVLTENVYECYDAKENGYKKLWISPNSRHAASDRTNPAEYVNQLRTFFYNIR